MVDGLRPGGGEKARVRLLVRGAVQGVGFRPFVFRLALELELSGTVRNTPEGVRIDAEGTAASIERLVRRIVREAPPAASIRGIERIAEVPAGISGFRVLESDASGPRTVSIPPDLALCRACRLELFDPADRRHRYPFINCTCCGPRFSIALELPYDRASTTMRRFAMCAKCRAEYEDPADRRFHAQPIACPDCGPRLELWDGEGRCRADGDEALRGAVEAVRGGAILAVKGLGGFHLVVDARDEAAVVRLRRLKARPEKPFAVMFPELRRAWAWCALSRLEARILCSRRSPIVIVDRRLEPLSGLPPLSRRVSPDNPWVGAMLPYTPLHALLLHDLDAPVVATSGNRSEEPICIDEREAIERLAGIADLFLVHDRPIARPLDDSIVRVIAGRPVVLRHARGYAPTHLELGGWGSAIRAFMDGGASDAEGEGGPPRTAGGDHRRAAAFDAGREGGSLLAAGGHHKGAVAMTVGGELVLGPHLGDLDTLEADVLYRRSVDQLAALYGRSFREVACDAHPDYYTTRYAEGTGVPLVRVQHHHAHLLACMADNGLEPDGGERGLELERKKKGSRSDSEGGPLLGVAWDGAGAGTDGTVFGGEWFLVSGASWSRVAHMRTFALPGGDRAAREPRRSALGMLFALSGEAAFERVELPPLQAFERLELAGLRTMLLRGLNTPRTSSVGRLFDAVAALIGMRQVASFEGQAAMGLEAIIDPDDGGEAYPFRLVEPASSEPLVVDWGPMVEAILEDRGRGTSPGRIAARFHLALAEIIVAVARRIGSRRVLLSGGCFQNRALMERTVAGLEAAGIRHFRHARIPPNDGGLAVGQALAALGGNAGAPGARSRR